ncbi:DUF6869 domain-containing protein [Acidovorax sp.]|uniref:DUF6869 domain-containing protein n=1 Tax=Acidovorax sp. TaxID=1872122 RepID=UPI002ACE8A4C|nr:hypothetical protein [Acidovorax sp.]MDZ7862294.1 hypothetical protein [Acidovorax sp.]
MTQLDHLVDEWIIGQSHGGVDSAQYQARQPLMLEVMSLPDEAPEMAWQFILAVIARKPPQQVLQVLSALLLEDLLTAHGPLFIERAARQAATCDVFKKLLGDVWLDPEDTPVWRDVYAIAGVKPPFPEGLRTRSAERQHPADA